MSGRYAGQNIALLTQHGKEQVIAPALEPALGCRIQRVEGFDTDQLGTFTREIPRAGSQLDAARRKARIGMELSGLPVGLASEGSFVVDPVTGLIPWNIELLVWIDDRLGIEVVAGAQGAARSGHLLTTEWARLESFAVQTGFPEHGIILRPNGQSDPRMHKGIADWAALRQAFATCAAESAKGQVFVENDLRAFANPTRMARIAEAADDLRRRLLSACPACDLPGYWIAERLPGLPCEVCRMPTPVYRTERWQCPACQYRSERVREDRQTAGAEHCAACNP